MNGIRFASLAAVSISVALVTGCSSSKSTSAANGTSPQTGQGVSSATSAPVSGSNAPAQGDGCQYVTAEQVSSLVGATVTAEAQPAAPPFQTPSCLYESSTVPLRQITVAVYPQDKLAALHTDAAAFLQSVRNNLSGVTPVPGLGDEAIQAGSSVYARKGGTAIHITAGIGGTSDTALNAVHKVAELVLAQL